MSSESARDLYGPAAVTLLKGVLTSARKNEWDMLLRYQGRLQDYFATLDLTLIVDAEEGYAYLQQRHPEADEERENFPRLMGRRKLSYSLTLLLVALRKRLIEFDEAGDASRLVLSLEQMLELVRVFWPENESSAHKRRKKFQTDLNKLVEYGFLSPLKAEADRYEVNRVLKAYLPVDKIVELEAKLVAYAAQKSA